MRIEEKLRQLVTGTFLLAVISVTFSVVALDRVDQATGEAASARETAEQLSAAGDAGLTRGEDPSLRMGGMTEAELRDADFAEATKSRGILLLALVAVMTPMLMAATVFAAARAIVREVKASRPREGDASEP